MSRSNDPFQRKISVRNGSRLSVENCDNASSYSRIALESSFSCSARRAISTSRCARSTLSDFCMGIRTLVTIPAVESISWVLRSAGGEYVAGEVSDGPDFRLRKEWRKQRENRCGRLELQNGESSAQIQTVIRDVGGVERAVQGQAEDRGRVEELSDTHVLPELRTSGLHLVGDVLLVSGDSYGNWRRHRARGKLDGESGLWDRDGAAVLIDRLGNGDRAIQLPLPPYGCELEIQGVSARRNGRNGRRRVGEIRCRARRNEERAGEWSKRTE